MELRTNCKNCGASLHYDETNYGKKVQCKYCRQEYHVDSLGKIEEYRVKLEFMGKIIDFYIGSCTITPLFDEFCYLGDGKIRRNDYGSEIKLELIGKI